MDKIDPAEPIDRIDPAEPTHRMLASEATENADPAETSDPTDSTDPSDCRDAADHRDDEAQGVGHGDVSTPRNLPRPPQSPCRSPLDRYAYHL